MKQIILFNTSSNLFSGQVPKFIFFDNYVLNSVCIFRINIQQTSVATDNFLVTRNYFLHMISDEFFNINLFYDIGARVA